MSLLNLASDGNRSVLVTIYRLLLAEKSIDRERLLALCAPAGVADPKHARATLNNWVAMGLFGKSEQDKISIHPQIPARERREEFLRRVARNRVLDAENNKRFWETARCLRVGVFDMGERTADHSEAGTRE